MRKTSQFPRRFNHGRRNAWDHIRKARQELDPHGDFDDFGRSEGAALYHYAQKRKYGRF